MYVVNPATDVVRLIADGTLEYWRSQGYELLTDSSKLIAGPPPIAGTEPALQAPGGEGTAGTGTAPDANTATKGLVQLAGDLAGTASAPTVPGLMGKASSTDSRLSDARTPTAHAGSHAPGAGDDLTTALSASTPPVALGAVASSGTGTGFSRQGHVHPRTGLVLTLNGNSPDASGNVRTSYPGPMDFGYLAWTAVPIGTGTNVIAPSATGRTMYARTRMAAAGVISNVSFAVKVAAAGFSASNAIGLFDANGNLLTQTADLAAVINSIGYKTVAFATPYSAAAGEALYLGILVNATTLPNFVAAIGDSTSMFIQSMGAAGAHPVYAPTTTSAALASFTPSTTAAGHGAVVFALS